ncbi:inositol monophosphatase family protein [Caenispirillum bisanense]|uniref:inositol monophosphatase family protein n=1 Tax=Caenispirillum bisanense TaxID=414052 RepID=UPI0031D0ACE5
MALRSPNLNVMVNAAKKAARAMVRDFGEVEQLQVSVKGPSDFVSAADLRAEKILRAELSKARPGWGFLGEEGGETPAAEGALDHRWIVDPIDGTTNFIHGMPHFAISIGLERAGELQAGVIYNPITDEMFFAEKGGGAFLNERRLRVAGRQRLDQAVIGTGIPHLGRGEHGPYLRELAHVMTATAGIRRMGSAALDLAYVAAGRYDGFWEHGLKPWDIAAGILLVKEAGGFVADLDGKGGDPMKSGNIIAANERLIGPLGDLIRKANA